jgi:bifunctional ADP-heptose synthase (sugar kinase/adenylyltransferase)
MKNFKGLHPRILVVGDLMIDHSWEVARESPSNVQVVDIKRATSAGM